MIRSLPAALFLLVLAGCSSDRTFDMTWSLTSTGACSGPGIDPTYAGQKEITLHYTKAPNHFVVVCSDKLASALASGGKPVVPMVERRTRGHGNASATSICSIAGVVEDPPGSTCAFTGHVSSGYEKAADPSPWD